MNFRNVAPTPARRFGLILAANFLAVLAVLAALTRPANTPWLGLRLAPAAAAEADPGIVVLAATGPASAIPAGAHLVAIASAKDPASAITLRASDLMEEPDVLADYTELNAFYARQSLIAAVLKSGPVLVHWREPASDNGAPQGSGATQGDTALHVTRIEPGDRPLGDMPATFWFQIVVSVAGCLLAAWVWALRPADWGTRMFMLTGLAFPVFALPAALYSSRELALAGELFHTLGRINHWGSFMFGAALTGIFLAHPRLLVRPVHLVWPFVLFNLWGLSDLLQFAPDLDWGNRFLVMTEMLAAIVLGVVQWRKSRGAVLERAALRWLLLSILVGSGLFILTTVVTVALGWLPVLPQAYAFGFFLFIYIGIALGLARYRLFELDVWAWRMLIWVGGALLVIGLDALFVLMLDWSAAPALGVSVWLAGTLYFPLRQWLWRKLTRQRRLHAHEFLAEVVNIAFRHTQQDQENAWSQLLRDLYDPLEARVVQDDAPVEAAIREDGLALAVPACGAVRARLLRNADRGRRLFTTRDRQFIAALCALMTQAAHSRDAYEQGATAERTRIAQDMHDDIGARLLMLIHRAPDADTAELARAAMRDLRTALAALDRRAVPLAHALADWRAEAGTRCEAADVELEWHDDAQVADGTDGALLDARHKSVLEHVLRECLTNALRHAHPTKVAIDVRVDDDGAHLVIENDGADSPPEAWRAGRGTQGLRQRLTRDGGSIEFSAPATGWVRATIQLPLVGAAA